ncbi:hypothetical protein GGR58DRAFT_421087 [Xylaria digitata]|nr:hypothetical protein GGR58DRAFT_421087 [Xylaria digitata]
MQLNGRLTFTVRRTITYNKHKLHTARSVSYATISTPITRHHRPLLQSSLLFPRPFQLARPPYSTSPSSHKPPPSPTMDTSETKTGNNNDAQPESQSSAAPAPLPALPAAGDGTSSTLEVGGAALRLDRLGPLVVNEDGTMSRIENWEKMADIERENTLRILGKRNQMRLAKLRAAGSGNSAKETMDGAENK